MSENSIRLTQYSHGAGCGCKISPKVLETILHSEQAKFVDPNLLVGNETRDDAAVYDRAVNIRFSQRFIFVKINDFLI